VALSNVLQKGKSSQMPFDSLRLLNVNFCLHEYRPIKVTWLYFRNCFTQSRLFQDGSSGALLSIISPSEGQYSFLSNLQPLSDSRLFRLLIPSGHATPYSQEPEQSNPRTLQFCSLQNFLPPRFSKIFHFCL
jgi:hypothetical protein